MKNTTEKKLAVLTKAYNKVLDIINKGHEKFEAFEAKHNKIANGINKKMTKLKEKIEAVEIKKYGLTPETFNGLKNTNPFSKYFKPGVNLRADAKKYGVEIVYDKNNIVVLKIANYIEARLFETSSWGLGHNKIIFDKYVTEKKGTQYFMFNFNLPLSDLDCMIGFTDYPGKKHQNVAFNSKSAHVISRIQDKMWYTALAKNQFKPKNPVLVTI